MNFPRVLLFLLLLAMPAWAQTNRPFRVINVGATANDGTGDSLRTSQQKANENFSNSVSGVAVSTNTLADGQVLTWNAAMKRWTNAESSASGPTNGVSAATATNIVAGMTGTTGSNFVNPRVLNAALTNQARLVAFGDSMTDDFIPGYPLIKPGTSWLRQLQALTTLDKVTVVNPSLSGTTLTNRIANYTNVYQTLIKPYSNQTVVAVVFLGSNDIATNGSAQSSAQVISNLTKFYGMLQADGAIVAGATIPGTTDRPASVITNVNNWILTNTISTYKLDFAPLGNANLLSDGIHPNLEGSYKMATNANIQLAAAFPQMLVAGQTFVGAQFRPFISNGNSAQFDGVAQLEAMRGMSSRTNMWLEADVNSARYYNPVIASDKYGGGTSGFRWADTNGSDQGYAFLGSFGNTTNWNHIVLQNGSGIAIRTGADPSELLIRSGVVNVGQTYAASAALHSWTAPMSMQGGSFVEQTNLSFRVGGTTHMGINRGTAQGVDYGDTEFTLRWTGTNRGAILTGTTGRMAVAWSSNGVTQIGFSDGTIQTTAGGGSSFVVTNANALLLSLATNSGLKTITAGTGIVITNESTNIVIAATGAASAAALTNVVNIFNGASNRFTGPIYGDTNLYVANIVIGYSPQFAATNATTGHTNFTLNFNASAMQLWATNSSFSLTNTAGLADNQQANLLIDVPSMPFNRTVVWPTLGGPGYGLYIQTNFNSSIWGTFTNGWNHKISLSAFGTNVAVSVTAWK